MEPPSKIPKTYQTALLQVVAYRKIQATVNSVLSVHHINTTQWIMLGYIHDNPKKLRIADLAQIIQVEDPLITKLAKELLQNGLIATSAHSHDGRARVLTLTKMGKIIITNTEKKLATKLGLLSVGIPREDMDSYFKTLSTFISNSKSYVYLITTPTLHA